MVRSYQYDMSYPWSKLRRYFSCEVVSAAFTNIGTVVHTSEGNAEYYESNEKLWYPDNE
jgi:hypothetical protein